MPSNPNTHRTLSEMIHISYISCITISLIAALIHTVHSRAVIPNGPVKQKLRIESPGKLEGNGLDLLPPQHIDAVKMDRNGELNKDFRQELFLGPDHEDFDNIPEKEGRHRLIEIFSKVDDNADEYLSQEELIKWIHQKTEEHFQEAAASSKNMFPMVDTNKDGVLNWDEYRKQFLLQRGYDKEKQRQLELNKQILSGQDEDDYIMYRDRWGRADEDGDDDLNPDEFLAFLHPEHCKSMLAMLVEEILHDLDRNGDKALTLAEFVSLEEGHNIDEMGKTDIWVRERKKEFEDSIDKDGDGQASLDELERYMDPKNKQHAESEARHLLGVADINEDSKLSLKEVLDNYYVFVGSKLYNYARNVHDEF